MNLFFLRPEWFLALLPLALLAVWAWRRRAGSGLWTRLVDPALMPHLVGVAGERSGRVWWWLGLIVGLLIVIALAGPAWRTLPQPVFKQQSALVVALDLSQSMNAADVRPSRLARARLKLIDLLKLRIEGQTALIVYAADAFTVSPLTDDSATIQSLVSSLDSQLMPAQGSRADLALKRAIDLLRNAGQPRGDVLLITDDLRAAEQQALRAIERGNYRLSILSLGSAEGAPIPAPNGGFVKDGDGSIVIARSDHAALGLLADDLGGVHLEARIDDSDIQQLQSLFASQAISARHRQAEIKTDRWVEEGPWLLLIVLPLAALAFRRGVLLSVLLVLFLYPAAEPVYAQQDSLWNRLWYNADQRGERAFKQGDYARAAELFEDPQWQAASHYRAGQYHQALELYRAQSGEAATYNRGNSLAQLGRLEEALRAYHEVLENNPGHEGARRNSELIEQMLQQQQQDQQGSPDSSADGEQSDQQSAESRPEQESSEQQPGEQQGERDSPAGDSDQQQSNSQPQPGDASDESAPGPQNRNEQPGQDEPDQAQQAEASDAAQNDTTAAEQAKAPASGEPAESDPQAELIRQAEEQWLRRVPDDPGGLLRNKFRYQYSRQPDQNRETQPW